MAEIPKRKRRDGKHKALPKGFHPNNNLLSDKNFYIAKEQMKQEKANERKDMLKSSFNQETRRELDHVDYERVVKAMMDTWMSNTRRQLTLDVSRPLLTTDPRNGLKLRIIDVSMFPRIEEFMVTGKELKSRFGFTEITLEDTRIIRAVQLAVFRKLETIPWDPQAFKEDPDKPLRDLAAKEVQKYPMTPDETYKVLSKEPGIADYYKKPEYKVLYHSFYPLVKPDETKAVAVLEMYKGFLSTMLSWGVNFQEGQTERFTRTKVETDQKIIKDKVKDFEKTVNELTKDKS